MIGSTLFGYFFRSHLRTATLFFLGIVALSYMILVVEFARQAGGAANYSFSGNLILSALKLPFLAQTAIPFIVLFASIRSLIALNQKYELVVARSAGVSAWQFLAPICIANFLIGVLAIAALNPATAMSFTAAQDMEAQIRSGRVATRDNRITPWMAQRTDEGLTIIGAEIASGEPPRLTRATFLRFDAQENITERIDAESALLADGEWILENAVRYRTTGARDALDRLRIKSGLKPEFVSERFANPNAIALVELPQMIRTAQSLGLSANGFSTRMHSLIALPFLLVAMTLIAATVSVHFMRTGQSTASLTAGVVAGFLLYVASVLADAFGRGGVMPPIMAAWSPVIVAGFLGSLALLFTEDG